MDCGGRDYVTITQTARLLCHFRACVYFAMYKAPIAQREWNCSLCFENAHVQLDQSLIWKAAAVFPPPSQIWRLHGRYSTCSA